VEVCDRAYRLLVEEEGFDPRGHHLRPQRLTVGTGIEEHADYAVAFIEATRRIKAELPHAPVSGGVSNVSFAFRGNNPVREAMHAAFLYHAIAAGLDMGIVNAGQLAVYERSRRTCSSSSRTSSSNRRPDATERLVAFAEGLKARDTGAARGARRLALRHRRGAPRARPREGASTSSSRPTRSEALARSSARRSPSSRGR
jgi:5-methyltetrahydrofolate--homocysteine methyltransferase